MELIVGKFVKLPVLSSIAEIHYACEAKPIVMIIKLRGFKEITESKARLK